MARPPPRKLQVVDCEDPLAARDNTPNQPPSSCVPCVKLLSSVEVQEEGTYCGSDDVSDDVQGSRASCTSSKRKKEKFGMRKACERCRKRKNKCDGNFPCSMCVRSFQDIQTAGGLCLFSSPEEMCVRNNRKPMSRTSSRYSNDSENRTRASHQTPTANEEHSVALNGSLLTTQGDGQPFHSSDWLGRAVGHASVDAAYTAGHPLPADARRSSNAQEQVQSAEDYVVEDSDAEAWNESGIMHGHGVRSSHDFFIDEWAASPARSAEQLQQIKALHAQELNMFSSLKQQPVSSLQLNAPEKSIDGIAYRIFSELSWIALELCEPLSSISLLFWRSLQHIDVPQWLSTRFLLSCCNIRCNSAAAGGAGGSSACPNGRIETSVAADHHKLLQLAVIIHGCSSGEADHVMISRDAVILLDSMVVRLSKKVLLSAKAAARGDVGASQSIPYASARAHGSGSMFLSDPPPDFTVVTAINVFISLCCSITCVSAFSTTPEEDYDAVMNTLSSLCSRYTISLDCIKNTFPYLKSVTDINLQYSLGEEMMLGLMKKSSHLLQADSLVTKLFCCDSFVLRLLARATCFKFLERFHSHTPFLLNNPPCMDPVHVFQGFGHAPEGSVRFGVHESPNCEAQEVLPAGDYSLAMLFGARHCLSRQLSLCQALGLKTGPAPPVFDLAAAGKQIDTIEKIKKYFDTFSSIRQQKGAGSRSSATFFWFKWSLDAVSAVMLYKAADTSSATCSLSIAPSPHLGHESSRDTALLSSLSKLVQEVVGLRQSLLFLMEPSASAALTVIINIVMTQRARSPAYEELWKNLSMAVSSAATSSVSGGCSCSIIAIIRFVDVPCRACDGGGGWQRQFMSRRARYQPSASQRLFGIRRQPRTLLPSNFAAEFLTSISCFVCWSSNILRCPLLGACLLEQVESIIVPGRFLDPPAIFRETAGR
jgi:hypothetical protein